jgi:hypothetical protein
MKVFDSLLMFLQAWLLITPVLSSPAAAQNRGPLGQVLRSSINLPARRNALSKRENNAPRPQGPANAAPWELVFQGKDFPRKGSEAADYEQWLACMYIGEFPRIFGVSEGMRIFHLWMGSGVPELPQKFSFRRALNGFLALIQRSMSGRPPLSRPPASAPRTEYMTEQQEREIAAAGERCVNQVVAGDWVQ